MASPHPNKRPLERSHRFTTLPPLIRHFIGIYLQVELKNGQSYIGTLNEADDSMNLVLRRASSTSVDDNPTNNIASSTIPLMHEGKNGGQLSDLTPPLDASCYQLLHIRGSSIRYIHFPSKVDLPTLIKLGIDRERSAQNKYKRGKRKK